MRDAVIGGEKGAVEDTAGVGTGEVAGFGDGVEELAEGVTMDGKVVD